jgi:Fe-S cluster biogenesis protein NfuA
MGDLDRLLTRLETLLEETEQLDEPVRAKVFELLDGIDALHRAAMRRLGEALDEPTLRRLRADPGVAWLFSAYGVGVDEQAAAELALDAIRPYIHSHGGSVDVLAAEDGVVRVKLAGSCSGCTASAVTLREGVEQALAEGLPGFTRLEVEADDAAPHPPPGPTLVELSRFPAR